MEIPRFLIAGTHSGVGKTTITSGIMQLLTDFGYRVQGFKVGPDYIDPSYHTLATGRLSKNLDTWLLSEDKILELFTRNCVGADIAVIEGVMGLFDGFRGNSQLGSTAHIAKLTKTPVILIVDAKSMGQSVAAVVYGFKNLDPEINLAGVILNKVASQRHLEILTQALDSLKITIFGHVFRDNDFALQERHLGLIPVQEKDGELDKLQKIADQLKDYISVDKIIETAKKAIPIFLVSKTIFNPEDKAIFKGLRIGYAFDKGFTFYYRDAIELLEHLGAEVIAFSPLEDSCLPKGLSGLFIGGGFPELFLEELSTNLDIMQSIRNAYCEGMPIYAECGGFMYLTEEIKDFSGKKFKMVGIIPGSSVMNRKLANMGYREGHFIQNSILGNKGDLVRGHEFHYSTFQSEMSTNIQHAFCFTDNRLEGYVRNNLLASYLHIHFASDIKLAKIFLAKCHEFKNREAI